MLNLAVMAYALFNWRQYVEHEEFMRRLNPFVTSLHLHERLAEGTIAHPLPPDVLRFQTMVPG